MSRFARRVAAAATLGVAAWLAGCAAAPPATPPAAPPARDGFSFAVVGDMPYRASEVAPFGALLKTIDADPQVRFILHTGDLKGGAERCSDDLLRERHAQLDAVRALVYTPGDNEWTDCHRALAGAFVPTERLAFLRRLFFARPERSLGREPLALVSQAAMPAHAAFVENALFVHQRVLFAAVHVVGSGNGLAPWDGLLDVDSAARPRADRLAEVAAREAAAVAWIERAFDEAGAQGAAAVVVLMQANPHLEKPAGQADRAPFDRILEALKRRALAFGKPVLLVQGDHHELIVDTPWARDDEPAPRVPRFVRLQGFGSPRLHWVKVYVDPARAGVFAFEPRF